MNPLVPTALDGVLMSLSLAALVLALAAFISMIRTGWATGWCFLAWVVIVFLVPVIGPAAWFLRGRGRRARELQRSGGLADRRR